MIPNQQIAYNLHFVWISIRLFSSHIRKPTDEKEAKFKIEKNCSIFPFFLPSCCSVCLWAMDFKSMVILTQQVKRF